MTIFLNIKESEEYNIYADFLKKSFENKLLQTIEMTTINKSLAMNVDSFLLLRKKQKFGVDDWFWL